MKAKGNRIARKGKDMYIPVREGYTKSTAHHGDDLALVKDIV